MRFILTISLLFGVLSCTTKLLSPLKSGMIYKRSDSLRVVGDGIYLVPHRSLEVRAAERCTILKVVRGDDSAYIILAHGKFDVAYGNLKISYVSKGQILKRGQIIGEIYDNADPHTNLLEVSVRKDNKAIRPNW